MAKSLPQINLDPNGGNYLSLRISVGKSQRSSLSRSMNSPGPGAYDCHLVKFGGPRAVITGRHNTSVASIGPGPGQYSTNSRVRENSITFRYTMAGRNYQSTRDFAPGPGTYNVVEHRMKRGVKFGKDRREVLSQSYSIHVPGPGAYDCSNIIDKGQRAPKYS